MKELLYLEAPTPDSAAVLAWLHDAFAPALADSGEVALTPTGLRWQAAASSPGSAPAAVAIFLWSVQRTTYLKAFRWGDGASLALAQAWRSNQQDRQAEGERNLLQQLRRGLAAAFPPHYPEPPEIDLTKQDIFAALGDRYPLTVKYFQQMPQGERDLQRVYWWERRWRDSVRSPQTPRQVVFSGSPHLPAPSANFDLIYLGGALGVIHAATMARRGHRVLLIERLPFGRMNREWNISRQELQTLLDLELLSTSELESLIACEYEDGFHKFFDGNTPASARAAVLHTPTVLNVAIAADQLIQLCGQKLREAGGEIWDETEFERVDINAERAIVQARHLPTGQARSASARLVLDAMGTASPIAWQLNGDRTFDSVCPTVGAVITDGIPPEVWDLRYGDVLFSHGDISRGRQLIWELFPAGGNAVTVYLFHYHQIHPDNPGSLLEMYEDFFAILPEYRRCNLEELTWGKATFGYIPGHFNQADRPVAFDRLLALGDAASLQSPLVFTGFGSLVRNLGRLTDLLETALRHDLLTARSLDRVRAYQSNVAVTWMFSKGMMVPTGRTLPPARANAMLNTFFGLLAAGPPDLADSFIKDRFSWMTFNGLALKAAVQTPMLLWWIFDSAGPQSLVRWLGSYWAFTWSSLLAALLGWLPGLARRLQPWLEPRAPQLWLTLLAQCYALDLTAGRSARVARSHPAPPENPASPQPPDPLNPEVKQSLS